MANTLLSAFRSEDTVGRLGGDEFLVYIKGAFPRAILEDRLKKLLDTLRTAPGSALTSSIGLTYVYSGGVSYSEYLRRSDMALYHSKRSGKDCFCFYEDLASSEETALPFSAPPPHRH